MSYSEELPKTLMEFLKTPTPHGYPQKQHVIEGGITATHSTYKQLENPRTVYKRCSVIQDSNVARVTEIIDSLPPASQEKLLEDIFHADPVLLEAAASLMLNHHVLVPVKTVLNLVWATYLNNMIRSKDRTDKRTLYLFKHFEYGFAIRSQHQDSKEQGASRQDHILTFEPYRLHENIKKTTVRPAEASSPFCSNDEFNTALDKTAASIGRARDNERLFKLALEKETKAKRILVKDLPCLAMTIVEEKKPGTLSPDAWQEAHNHIGQGKVDTAEANQRKITAQIQGYAFTRKCPYILVSQLDVNVLLVVENAGCKLLKTPHTNKYELSKDGVAVIIVDEDIQQRTAREKVFYMVVERASKTVLR